MMSRQGLLLSCVCATSLLTTAAAYAQQNDGTIEELVVTAEKRAQSLQDIPIAITAFSSDRRDLMGIKSVQEMTNFTPGLNYNAANDSAAVRGVARLSNSHAIPVPVAVYDDGIYTASTTQAGRTPIFIDRNEVLRGPQGTLYGRNSLGGAINIISKRPTEDLYAEVRGTAANYGYTRLEGALSGPIADGLQFRLAGSWEKQRDGYFENVVPGMPSEGGVLDQYYLEGQIQAKFGEHLEMWTKVNVQGWNNGSGGPGGRSGFNAAPINPSIVSSTGFPSGIVCAGPPNVANVVNASLLGCVNPAATDPRKFASTYAQTVSIDDTYSISSQWTWHFDSVDLKYVGGGQNYHYTLKSDGSSTTALSYQVPLAAGSPCSKLAAVGLCGPMTVFPRQVSNYEENYHNLSHELTLISTGDSKLSWVGGLYYYKEGIKQPVSSKLLEQPQLAGSIYTPADLAAYAAALAAGKFPLPQGTAPPVYDNRIFDDRPNFHTTSYAVYGQASYQFTDTLTGTLGLRWSHDHLYGTEAMRAICFGGASCQTTPQTLGNLAVPFDAGILGGSYIASIPQGVVVNPAGNLGGGIYSTPDGFLHRDYDASWQATTGTARIQWQPDRDTMAYASYSRGYMMGGFQAGGGASLSFGQFPYTDAEHSNDFEIGIKKTFNRNLQINIDAFYEDLSNYQVPLTVVSQSDPSVRATNQSRYLNVPKASIKGVEVEAIWTPLDHLTIYAMYDYNDSRVEKLTGIVDPNDPQALAGGANPLIPLATCTAAPLQLCDTNTGLIQRPQDLKGSQLPQSPKNKVAINVSYGFVMDAGSLTPSLSYIWRDKQYSNLFTRPGYAAPSWDQWDLTVTWKGKDNKYSIIGYVKNIGDSLGYGAGSGKTRVTGTYTAAQIAALGLTPSVACAAGSASCQAVFGYSNTYTINPPRTYGLEFQYRF